MASKFVSIPTIPSFLLLDPLLKAWLVEDMGRGDRVTQALLSQGTRLDEARWVAKEAGVIAGLPIAARVFQLLDPEVRFETWVAEGETVIAGQPIAALHGPFDALLSGERVALNLAMRLSGIASATRKFVEVLEPYNTRFADTRKTTPGMRILEKYASKVGGAVNHRMGLDDAAMIKDNHIAAAGGIAQAIELVRGHAPYPLTIEVETESLGQVQDALVHGVDIIMLDNMKPEMMTEAVKMIRATSDRVKIEASGNVTLETLQSIAKTGVDYISSSAPMTRSPWMDISMRF